MKPKQKPATKPVAAKKNPIAAVHRSVPMKLLDPSPRNRKVGDVTELMQSIQGPAGLLSPLVVRAHPKKKGRFEIVCGHRRWTALTKLAWKEVPVVVRVLSDLEAIQCMLVENLGREDVPPIEEAEAFASLHNEPHNLSVEDIASQVGKSEQYVYQRIRIAQKLIAAAKKAVADGKLLIGGALILARLDDEKEQKEALQQLVGHRDEPANAHDARWIVGRFLRVLNDAPFDRGDATLPGGACTACPKRSDRQAALFAEGDDVKTAKCMDGGCWSGKVDARNARLVKEAKESGAEVLKGAAAKKILPHGSGSSVARGFVALDMPCQDDPKRRTWGEVLKKAPADKLPPVMVVVAADHHGVENVVEVVTEKGARAAARAAGVSWAQPKKNEDKDPKADAKAARAEQKLEAAMWDREVRELSAAVAANPHAVAVIAVLRLALLNAEPYGFRYLDPAVRRGFTHEDLEKRNSRCIAAARDHLTDFIESSDRSVGDLVALMFELNWEQAEIGDVERYAEIFAVDLSGLEERAKADLEKAAEAKKNARMRAALEHKDAAA